MKTNYSMVKISGFALTLALMIGFGMVGSANAQRYDDRYGYGRNDDTVRWNKDRTRQYAYVLGYHTAYSDGRDAREQGFRGSYNNTPGYRDDDNGWLVWMGYQNDYRGKYREGYRDGFNDGMRGTGRRYDRDDVERLLGGNMKDVYEGGRDNDRWDNDRWDGNGRNNRRDNDRWGNDRWGNGNGRMNRQEILRIAEQNAYNDGLRRGQDDRRRNRSYNYSDSNEYRDATRGYRSEYGDRELYRQGYREGFQRGYNEGYRGNGGGGRWPWNR